MRQAIIGLSVSFVLFLAGCSSDGLDYEKTALIGENDIIKIEVMENHRLSINDEKPIPISFLAKELDEIPKTDETIVSITYSGEHPVGDLTDIQRILRDAEMLRINYAAKDS